MTDAEQIDLAGETDTSELYLVKRKKGGNTTRNRPGMEQLAAKQAGSTMNLGSEVFPGKGIQCYRCGKTDHVLRDCPIPYTKTLAFAPQKSDGKQGKGKGKPAKGAFIAEAEEKEVPETDAPPESNLSNENHPSEVQNPMYGTEESQPSEQWLSSWF